MDTTLITSKGNPHPLGSSQQGERVNFALFSQEAIAVSLCLFNGETKKLLEEIPLSLKSIKQKIYGTSLLAIWKRIPFMLIKSNLR